jgi:hypothetical protein
LDQPDADVEPDSFGVEPNLEFHSSASVSFWLHGAAPCKVSFHARTVRLQASVRMLEPCCRQRPPAARSDRLQADGRRRASRSCSSGSFALGAVRAPLPPSLQRTAGRDNAPVVCQARQRPAGRLRQAGWLDLLARVRRALLPACLVFARKCASLKLRA